jgi:hypothetical protein
MSFNFRQIIGCILHVFAGKTGNLVARVVAVILKEAVSSPDWPQTGLPGDVLVPRKMTSEVGVEMLCQICLDVVNGSIKQRGQCPVDTRLIRSFDRKRKRLIAFSLGNVFVPGRQTVVNPRARRSIWRLARNSRARGSAPIRH